MPDLSNQAARANQVHESIQREKKRQMMMNLDEDTRYYYEGTEVLLVSTYSSRGKRIAVIEDTITGETQEVFFDQLG